MDSVKFGRLKLVKYRELSCRKAILDDASEVCLSSQASHKCDLPKLLVKHWDAGHPDVRHTYIRASYGPGYPVFHIQTSGFDEGDIILDSELDMAWAKEASWH